MADSREPAGRVDLSRLLARDYWLIRRVKAQYDPGNLFRANYNIVPQPDRPPARSLTRQSGLRSKT